MEAKGAPERDKRGQLGMLMWITNQNIRDIKETVNKYIQDANDPSDDLIKRLVILRDQLHGFWKELNPS